MNTIELLINRNSHAKLTAPAPSEDELATLFAAAMRAPDHGLLRPWRFMVVNGPNYRTLP